MLVTNIFSFTRNVFYPMKDINYQLCLTFYSIETHFDSSTTDNFLKNIVGKGEIARYEQFLLFPQCFLLSQIIVSQFVHIFYIKSLFATEMEEPKIGISGKGLTLYDTIPNFNDPQGEAF